MNINKCRMNEVIRKVEIFGGQFPGNGIFCDFKHKRSQQAIKKDFMTVRQAEPKMNKEE